jgi:hypothetical protein
MCPSRSAAEDAALVKELTSRHKVLAAAEDTVWAENMAEFMLGWLRPVSLRPDEVVDELPLVPGVKAALKASLAADPEQRCSLDCFIQLMELGAREIEDLLAAAAQQEEAAAAAVAVAKVAEDAAVLRAQAAVAAAEERERVVREEAAAEVDELQARLAAAVAELQRLKGSSAGSSSSSRQVEWLGLSKGDSGVVELGRLKTVRPAGAGEESEETSLAPCTPTKLSDDGEGSSSSSSSSSVEMVRHAAVGAVTSHPAAAATLPAPSTAPLRAAAARWKQEEGEGKQQVMEIEHEGEEGLEGGKEEEVARGCKGLGRVAAAAGAVVAAVGCKGFKLPRKLWRVCRMGVCAVLESVAAG